VVYDGVEINPFLNYDAESVESIGTSLHQSASKVLKLHWSFNFHLLIFYSVSLQQTIFDETTRIGEI
jgi:hypothetical protein